MQEIEYDQIKGKPRKFERNGVTFHRKEYVVPDALLDVVREAVAEMTAAYLVMAGKAKVKGKAVPLPLMPHYTRLAVLRSERAALAMVPGSQGVMLRDDNSAMHKAAAHDFDVAFKAYQANVRKARELAIARKSVANTEQGDEKKNAANS